MVMDCRIQTKMPDSRLENSPNCLECVLHLVFGVVEYLLIPADNPAFVASRLRL